MEIREDILNYKEITVKIIKIIKTEKYEELMLLLDKREKVIENLKQIDTKQFKIFCDEFDLIKLENELDELLSFKRNDIKFKLDAITKNMQASSSYNKMTDSPLIFSKKI